MSFINPQYLVETDWLEAHLEDSDLRILDCTVFLPNYFDPDVEKQGVQIVGGQEAWTEGHIPGSCFVDFLQDLTDRNKPAFMFPMPLAEQFAKAMSRYGVGEGSRVILYDRMVNIWAARVWWMLRAFGFENAAVLNGGWHKWSQEGRPVSTAPSTYPPAQFIAHPNPERIATKDEVLSAIGYNNSCIINALDDQEYAGTGPVRYGRPGHIPSSVNVSFLEILDADTNAYLPAEHLRQKFAKVEATNGKRVITYCGGGIAASSDALILTLLGVGNVAVYDGSMTEWAADPTLPLETN